MKRVRQAILGLILAAVSPAPGQVTGGTCLRFDGVNGYLDAGTAGVFNAYPLTVTAWIRTTNAVLAVHGIAGKYFDGSGNGWALFLAEGKVRGFYYRDLNRFIGGGANGWGVDSGLIADGQWHHIAFTVDAAGGTLYVDGTSRSFIPWSLANSGGAPTSAEPLRIGRYFTYGVRFDGDIDELTIWNVAHDPNTLNYLKHRRLQGMEPGLLAYWRFDDGAGSVATDSTPAARNAALISSPQWISSTAPLRLSPVAGTAFQADGVDDQVIVPHDARMNALPLTVMGWVRTAQTSVAYPGIITKFSVPEANGWGMALNNGALHTWYYTAGTWVDSGPTVQIANNQWQHIAYVVTATTARTYVNGNQVHVFNWPGGTTTTTAEPMRFGTYVGGAGRFYNGQLDHVSVWNAALTPAQILQYANTRLTGAEAGLIAAYEFNEPSGNIAEDLVANLDGNAPGGLTRTASLARIGDGSQHVVAALDFVNLGSRFAIAGSPTQGAFSYSAAATFWRFHDFGPAPAGMIIDAALTGSMRDQVGSEAALNAPARTTVDFALASYPASSPPTLGGRVRINTTLSLDPAQLDSVNNTYAAMVTLSHQENEGPPANDESWSGALTRLLHFNGKLFFGPVETRFTGVDHNPSPGALSGGGIATTLQFINNWGYLASHPSHRYNLFPAQNVTLFPDGRAVIGPFSAVILVGPAPDRDCVQNICFDRTNLRLDGGGSILGTARLQLPGGLSYSTTLSRRVTSPEISFQFTSFTPQLLPQPAVLTRSGNLYAVEESKPFWMQTSTLEWHVQAGEIRLGAPVSLSFVRQVEDNLLNAQRVNMIDPNAADRISNDGYYRNIGTAAGQVVVRANARGAALLTIDADLQEQEFRPHFPYTRRSISGHIPVIDGRLIMNDDVIDEAQSFLRLAPGTSVPVVYSRDCVDTNCSDAASARAVLQFTPVNDRLFFTRDGGLVANGAVPPQNLTWGFFAGDLFAQRTSDVQAGAFHMPGTFLLADQTALADAVRPAVLLFTGAGPALERPGTAPYQSGFADYAGLNFRAPAQGRSRLANRDTGWYQLVPEAKYYARLGGVSGLHQAANFSGPFELYGYSFQLTGLALSYLDSQNWESRTDGSVYLPNPSDFGLEFRQMKFLCRGALETALLPAGTPEKTMAYWHTAIQPRAVRFVPKSNDICAVQDRVLALGVETKLPVIPEKFQATLGFHASGHLVTYADGYTVDSRFPVPAKLSLKGPGESHYVFSTTHEGYFNNASNGPPDGGFYNLAGKLDVPFFEDVKTHLHITPLDSTLATIHVTGGWRAADKTGADEGWTEGAANFFSIAKFDATHRGFPPGVSLEDYRKPSTTRYRPRAQRNWLELVQFDYPLEWNPALRQFSSFGDAQVPFPIIDVGSTMRQLSPGKVDLDFAQDLELRLPRLKVLDIANDALLEGLGPLLSVSNAVREVLGEALGSTGLTKGTRGLQRLMRDQMDGLVRPVLEPALMPVRDALYATLVARAQSDGANFLRNVPAIVNGAGTGIKDAVRSVSVLGEVNGILNDVDSMFGLLDRMLGQPGNRQVIRVLMQKLVADQGPGLNVVASIGDALANELLAEIEPTLQEIDRKLDQVRAEFNRVRGATGDLNAALRGITSSGPTLDSVVQLAGAAVSNLMATVYGPNPDFLTANPDAIKQAISERLTVAVLNSAIPGKYQQTFRQFFYDDEALLNQLMDTLFQQVNTAVRKGITDAVGAGKDGLFKGLKGPSLLSDTFASAKIRGAPTFNGDALKKVRLDAALKLDLPDEMTFNGFMEIVELDSANAPVGCVPKGGAAAEITVGAIEVPLDWTGVGDGLTLSAFGRVTQTSTGVKGVGGGLKLGGPRGIELKAITIKVIEAQMTFGETENYFAARADVDAKKFGAHVGIFAGKSCRIDPLKVADPEVERTLTVPDAFTGVYLAYGGKVSINELFGIPSSCIFRLDGDMKTAFYYLDGTSGARFGGKQMLGVEGEILCILHGRLEYGMFLNVGGGRLELGGTATATGSIGPCPFCLEGSVTVTIKGVIEDGDIGYEIEF